MNANSAIEARGLAINLKKILYPKVSDEMKNLTPTVYKNGAWLAFNGIDSVNCHFSGKYVHTGLIEIAVIPVKPIKLSLRDLAAKFVSVCNEYFITLGGFKEMDMTQNILQKTSDEAKQSSRFFTPHHEGNICIVNFELSQPHPFIEIRIVENVRVMERYGIKHVCLKDAIKVGTLDEQYRNQLMTQALGRKDLTFTNLCMKTLIRWCYPAVHMRKIGSRDEVMKTIETFPSMRDAMIIELEEYQNDEAIRRITLTGFIARAIELELIPPLRTIENDFNSNVLYEFKTSILGH